MSPLWRLQFWSHFWFL